MLFFFCVCSFDIVFLVCMMKVLEYFWKLIEVFIEKIKVVRVKEE